MARTVAGELGARGEAIAAEYLQRQSMTVLARNWRCRDGELDLVVLDGGEIVFVEVKTRSGTAFGLPAEAVTNLKAQRIRRLASAWLAAHMEGWSQVRFDVVGIVIPGSGPMTIEHYAGVF